jgi:hypothetical protein
MSIGDQVTTEGIVPGDKYKETISAYMPQRKWVIIN